MFYLISLGIILIIARWLYHVMWQGLQIRGRLIFGAVAAFACGLSLLALWNAAAPLEWWQIWVWAAAGLIGWFIPELFQNASEHPKRWVISGIALASVLLIGLGGEVIARAVIGIYIILGVAAVSWLMFFKPAPKAKAIPRHRKRKPQGR